jgi:hypothetical protein
LPYCRKISGSEKVEVYQQVVQLVELLPFFPSLLLGSQAVIPLVEAFRKTAEKAAHGQVYLGMTAIHGRVYKKKTAP